jgi:phospholipid/cholesterol/gamma-HCH transport system ATP-binding protein
VIARRVEECLSWVDLEGVGKQSPSELSGGMRRRVALARTISFEPEFVLYDEPTTGLDPVTARKISRLFRDLDKKLSSTSILVTHDIECARTVASRWTYLSGGKIVANGTPDELLSSGDEELREFLLGGDPARELPVGRKGP